MLHAVMKKSSKLYERCYEDEITSTIFGPMDFMDHNSVHKFWLKFLNLKRHSPLKSCCIELWKRKRYGKNNSVEPDIFIEFNYEDENDPSLYLLVEIKWDSPLGEDQLEKQWKNFSLM